MNTSGITTGNWNVYKSQGSESKAGELYLVPDKASSPHSPITALPLTPMLNALKSTPLPMVADFTIARGSKEKDLYVSLDGGNERQKLELIG